jgi:hypothetical protein
VVELPGIELAAEIGVTCEDAVLIDARRRETTCGSAKGVDAIYTPRSTTRAVDAAVDIDLCDSFAHPESHRRSHHDASGLRGETRV